MSDEIIMSLFSESRELASESETHILIFTVLATCALGMIKIFDKIGISLSDSMIFSAIFMFCAAIAGLVGMFKRIGMIEKREEYVDALFSFVQNNRTPSEKFTKEIKDDIEVIKESVITKCPVSVSFFSGKIKKQS